MAKKIQLFLASLIATVPCLLAFGCSSGGSGSSSPAPTPTPAPTVTLSVSSLSFTGVDKGYPTAPQSVIITNSGTSSLVISNEQLTGADAANFSGVGGGVGNCSGVTLAPAADCTTMVEFTPGAASTYSAALSFTDNAGNSLQTVQLSGTYTGTAAAVAQAKFGYVADYSGTIYSYTISAAGTWTPTSPASVGIGDTPSQILIDSQGKFLFALGFLSGDVLSYAIDPATGVLTSAGSALSSAPDTRPENFAIDPSGTFLYVANTGNGTVTEYTVNRTSGALTLGATVTVPLAAPGVQSTLPGGLLTDPNGKFLYASAAELIVSYSIDTSTGALTQLATAQGFSCFNLKSDAAGKYLYCADDGSGLAVFGVDSSTGAVTGVTNSNSIPTGQGSTDVGLTPNSKYAFVTNRTDQTISLYTENAANGILTPQIPASTSQFGQPYAIAMDPGSQFAYVVLESGGIEIMTINSDGTLSPSSEFSVASPVAIAVYP